MYALINPSNYMIQFAKPVLPYPSCGAVTTND